MFRAIITGGKTIFNNYQKFLNPNQNYSILLANDTTPSRLFQKPSPELNLVRNVTKFSLQKGKRKTVKAALKRFYRLDWGGWIRTRAGRHKHLWRKTYALKKRLKEHVFVNATQATLLDKMVTNYWKKPKYYIDDPYEPYHRREEWWTTRRKPLP